MCWPLVGPQTRGRGIIIIVLPAKTGRRCCTALTALMISVTDDDLATCSGPADAANGAVSNVCRPEPQDETEYLCYFMHRLLDFRHPEIRSLASLLGSRDNPKSPDVVFELPCGGSYLSPFWYVRMHSEALAKAIARRSLLVKVSRGLSWAQTSVSVLCGLILTRLAGVS